MKITISNLKCYTAILDSDDYENSKSLIELEQKIPHLVHTKSEKGKKYQTKRRHNCWYCKKQVKPDDKSLPHLKEVTAQKPLILQLNLKQNRPYRIVEGPGCLAKK